MKVYYKKLVEGITIPSIIFNSQYSYHDMPVYEDGTIDCWERVALDDIAGKFNRNWLVTSVPDGKAISIHGLAWLIIANGKWNYTPESYQKHITDTVKSMNTKLTGLHKNTDEQKIKWEKQRTKWSARGKPYKIRQGLGYGLVDGITTRVFVRLHDTYHLMHVTGFADDTFLMCPNLGDSENIVTAQDLTDLVNDGRIACEPPKGSAVCLPGLGEFEVADNSKRGISPKEKLKEILELPNRAGNKETAHELCIKRYNEYLRYPDERARERLREAYESVPKHERIYLGDMDSKDSDYIRILYEPDRKREV